MIVTEEILEELSAKARASECLRANLDLRNSPEDQSQRMLNSLELGTVLFEAKDGSNHPLEDDEIY